MSYLIMRVKKHKSEGNIGGALDHLYRERETPNAEKDPKVANINIGAQSADQSWAIYRASIQGLKKKVRKNAVLAAEYFIGPSPEWWKEAAAQAKTDFFNNAIKFVQDKHGKKNVIAISIHMDETTPHLTAMVVPKDTQGKLNAREFFGGRQKLSDLQSEAWEAIGRPAGLQRGLIGSTAKHETIKKYYAKMGNIEEALKPPKIGLLDAIIPSRRQAVFDRDRDALRPLLEASLRAQQIETRNKEVEERLNKAGEAARILFHLKPEQIQNLKIQADNFREQNRLEKKKERDAKRDRSKSKQPGLGL